jgi:hypothetical protein
MRDESAWGDFDTAIRIVGVNAPMWSKEEEFSE